MEAKTVLVEWGRGGVCGQKGVRGEGRGGGGTWSVLGVGGEYRGGGDGYVEVGIHSHMITQETYLPSVLTWCKKDSCHEDLDMR